MGSRRPRTSHSRAHPSAPFGSSPDLAQPAARLRGIPTADARHGRGAPTLRRLPRRSQCAGARGPGAPSRRAGQPQEDSLMREILGELVEWTGAGEDIALATVVETWGSSPRPIGSKMGVTRSGKMAGSVSNGCIEGAVFEEAQRVLKSREPRVAAFGVADGGGVEVGLACGGHIEVVGEPLGPVHERLIAKLHRNEQATLRTNLVTGEAELVEGWTPPGSELAHPQGTVFVEPFRRPAHLIIVGAIHIAIPLHRLAKVMGYRVTNVDARAEFATKERVPAGDGDLVA